ncbi:MAG: hypothetical protein ACRD35_08730 [Candidatus Acidiferrales bacterium]
MNIQYVGFAVAPTSRSYTFRVFEALQQTREFIVKIQLGVFRSTSLRFQDGPDICFARLKHKLENETPETRVGHHLRLGDQEIAEYLQRRTPRKRR